MVYYNRNEYEEATSLPDAKKYEGDEEDGEAEELSLKFLDMYSTIYSMRQDLERVRKPLGTRENPGRSCRDLHFGHPQSADGNIKIIYIV